jgi:DNA-binding Xre family transcriptional regulator
MAKLRVREVAQERGVGIGKLSRLSDVSANTIRRIWHEPGYDATISTLQKIATALRVGVRDLIEEDQAPPKET